MNSSSPMSSMTRSGGWSRYHRHTTIGQGSFGIVYAATVDDPTSPEHGTVVAVKSIPIAHLSPDDVERTLQEVALLQALSHPNIVRFVESFADDRELCLVTEYVDGGDLSQLIAMAGESQSEIATLTILDMSQQLLSALSYLHRQRIIHRDVKPSNVFVTMEGVVKLGDFGVSKLIPADTPAIARTMIGTPQYLCPEICQGLGYSYGADVWAFGVVVYELASQRAPFHANNLLALANVVAAGEYDADILQRRADARAGPGTRASVLHEMLTQLIAEALRVEAGGRPSAEDLLASFFDGAQSPARELSPTRRISPGGRGTSPTFGGGARSPSPAEDRRRRLAEAVARHAAAVHRRRHGKWAAERSDRVAESHASCAPTSAKDVEAERRKSVQRAVSLSARGHWAWASRFVNPATPPPVAVITDAVAEMARVTYAVGVHVVPWEASFSIGTMDSDDRFCDLIELLSEWLQERGQAVDERQVRRWLCFSDSDGDVVELRGNVAFGHFRRHLRKDRINIITLS